MAKQIIAIFVRDCRKVKSAKTKEQTNTFVISQQTKKSFQSSVTLMTGLQTVGARGKQQEIGSPPRTHLVCNEIMGNKFVQV